MRNRFKRTRIFLLLCIWVLSAANIMAQNIQVNGKITDQATGEAIPGVNVVVKGTTQGTVSDINGQYQISAPQNSTLLFSFVGYVPEEVIVGNSQTLNVRLVPDVEKLDEVVVIGYGKVRKTDATGAVSVLGSRDFNKGTISSPQEALVGKIAGVVVTSGDGAPGSAPTIRIRGGSSLNASNDPLIVVNGIPLDNGGVSGSPNALSMINPNDIESYTVLKDASACAIYGARAANGVILITTKKAGKEFKVSYNGNYSVAALPKMLDVLSAGEYRTLVDEQIASGYLPASVTSMMGTDTTDWQKEIYRIGLTHDHNISVSGTTQKIPYRVSLGYTDQQGTLKTTYFKRATADININPSLLNDQLKINVNIKGMYNKNNFGSTAAIGGAVSFDPTKPVMNGDQRWRGYTTWKKANGEPMPLATANPVARLDLTENTSDIYRSIGNIQMDYALPFLKDLHMNLNLGYDYSKSNGINNVQDSTIWTYEPTRSGGRIENYNQTRAKRLFEYYLNYSKNIEALQSKVNLMAGYSYEKVEKTAEDSAYNYAEDFRIANNPSESPYVLISFYGRLNFDVMDKYLFTFTLRDDASSRFSTENHWGLFPSAAFAWKLKNESFLSSIKVLSELKLRLGYGVTGQQDLFTNDFPYLPIYRIGKPSVQYQLGNTFYTTLRPSGYDANIRWETSTTYNVGIDFGLFDNRLTGSIEYYNKTTKDLISEVNTAAGTNLTNVIITNVGDMENKGVEAALNVKVITTNDLFWEIGTNLSLNKNKITNLSLSNDPDYFIPTGGISGGTGNKIQVYKVGLPANSFYVYQQVYNPETGKPIEGVYVDRDKNGVINTKDLYIYKKAAPDAIIGLNSSVSYKNFSLSFSGRLSLGNYVYNNVASGSSYINLNSGGFMSNINKSATETEFKNAQYFSDYYVENASFFRMDYISLGYKLPKIAQKVNSQLSFTVKNAFIISKYSGLDPEVFNGIDNNFYPRSRTFLLGLNVDL